MERHTIQAAMQALWGAHLLKPGHVLAHDLDIELGSLNLVLHDCTLNLPGKPIQNWAARKHQTWHTIFQGYNLSRL